MLSVRGATVRYGSVTAVDGVHLDVPDGCVLALLGPSGCGKSTLLRAIAGLEPLTAGQVCWDAVDLARIPVHRRGFGLMFQDGVLVPHRTVAGNVAYGLHGRGGAAASDAGTRHAARGAADGAADGAARGALGRRLSERSRTDRVLELLELVGLVGYGPRRVATLSGGEAQRVALARALAPRPRLLLLDEPLAALDRALRVQLLVDLRAALTTTGTTSIFVTHDQGEAFAVADRVAVMRAGRIVQVGRPRDVWTRPVDEWTARFLGCSSVVSAMPELRPDRSWCSVTALGSVPGRAERVGLRPSALAVDPAGPVRGEVVALVPGPDHLRVSVRLGDDALLGDGVRPRGEVIAGGGRIPDGDATPSDGALPTGDGLADRAVVQAVAHPSAALVPGQLVRLRWDADGAALIGTAPDEPDGAERPVPESCQPDAALPAASSSRPDQANAAGDRSQ
jgi:thiamine transport system ATP-binding protein